MDFFFLEVFIMFYLIQKKIRKDIILFILKSMDLFFYQQQQLANIVIPIFKSNNKADYLL